MVGDEPLRGLTLEDFELTDDGKRQTLLGLMVTDLGSAADEEVAAEDVGSVAPALRRHFVLLFDLSYTDVSSVQRSQTAALDILAHALHPTDLVAVATYGTTSGWKLLINFTSDRGQAVEAVLGLEAPDVGARDPLGLTLAAPVPGEMMAPGLHLETGSQGDQEMAELQRRAETIFERTSRRQEVGNLARDFTLLARLLDGVAGRKHVLYLSEGFDNALAFASDDRQQISRMNTATESGEIWEVGTEDRFGSAGRQSQLDEMVEAFRRADCVVHTIDIRTTGTGATVADDTTRPSSLLGGNEGLSMMASGTGGSYLRNTNDIARSLRRVVDQTSVTYLLSYQSRNLKGDDKYHKIRVKLKDAPRGAKISHRPGYFEPRPFTEQSGLEQRIALGERLLAERGGGPVATEALALPMRHGDDLALVPLLLEVDGADLLGATRAATLQLQIFVYAFDPRGRVAAVISQTLGFDLAQTRPVLERSGVKFYGALELPAGRYTLRALVFEPDSGYSGLSIVDVDVPSFDPGEPVLLPPLFPDAIGSWLLARQQPPIEGEPPPFPFVVGDEPYLPAVRPSVQRGDPSRLFLVGSNLGGVTGAEGRLLDASGAVVGTVAFTSAERKATPIPGYQALVTTLDPSGLDGGEYTLEVTLNRGGDPPTTASIPLSVR
jgi:VWFA-related protein